MNNSIWIAGALFSLPVFVFAGSLLIDALRTRRLLPGLFFGNRDNSFKGMTRRKIKSNPNIVCGFPIYQKAREEAPFF
jgi:hypothetical protein